MIDWLKISQWSIKVLFWSFRRQLGIQNSIISQSMNVLPAAVLILAPLTYIKVVAVKFHIKNPYSPCMSLDSYIIAIIKSLHLSSVDIYRSP